MTDRVSLWLIWCGVLEAEGAEEWVHAAGGVDTG